MKVGFIGLGRMGQGMARRVLGAGHDLAVYDVVAGRRAEFSEAGARAANSVKEAASGRDVVITMLVEDAILTDVVLDPGGLRDSLSPGAIHLAMGTYGVATIQKLSRLHAESQQTLVAAPVLGRPDLAASGQLGIVVAGPAEAVRRCEPLFEVIGRRIFYAGTAPESANALKLANNLVLGCAIQAMSEAFSLVGAFGVAPETFYDVMIEGLFSAPAYKVYGKIMVEKSYDRAGSTISLNLKDANLILAAGDFSGVPLPSGVVFRDRLVGAIGHGDAEKDVAALALEQQRAVKQQP